MEIQEEYLQLNLLPHNQQQSFTAMTTIGSYFADKLKPSGIYTTSNFMIIISTNNRNINSIYFNMYKPSMKNNTTSYMKIKTYSTIH